MLKQAIADAANGTADDKKAVRAMFKKFEGEAPADKVDEVKRYYAMIMGDKKRGAAPTQDGTPAATPQPAQAAQAPSAVPTAPAKAPETKAAYLPPNQRGDSYEGPLEPPAPFGEASQGSLVR